MLFLGWKDVQGSGEPQSRPPKTENILPDELYDERY